MQKNSDASTASIKENEAAVTVRIQGRVKNMGKQIQAQEKKLTAVTETATALQALERSTVREN